VTRIHRALASASLVPGPVADARSEARRILDGAKAELEARRVAAIEEGRAQGRAELAAQLVALAVERDRQLAALEPAAVEVALLAAKRILGDLLVTEPDRIVAVVRPLLARVRRAHSIRLRVHPLDRPALQAQLAALCRDLDAPEGLVVDPDPGVSRGGCVLHSDLGSLDARIETQLEALANALAEKR
jgi:type III secretion system HrpE/YscL family protein